MMAPTIAGEQISGDGGGLLSENRAQLASANDAATRSAVRIGFSFTGHDPSNGEARGKSASGGLSAAIGETVEVSPRRAGLIPASIFASLLLLGQARDLYPRRVELRLSAPRAMSPQDDGDRAGDRTAGRAVTDKGEGADHACDTFTGTPFALVMIRPPRGSGTVEGQRIA